ncbi:MAG TPA: thioesterase family protein [Candidatus Limivicinus faecipullorum]|nr:thioesterase family protein [Candidatus Limivicinus faecipullorum]
MTELKAGLLGQAETTVNESNTAAAIGSGALPVFSTPHMIALMENASMNAIAPCLEEGQGSVGVRIDVEHLAATPLGMSVRAESCLTKVEGRMLSFEVKAWAGDELIGRGSHQRCIVLNRRFMEKTQAKLK